MSIPALRFKEFSGDWEEKTLQELADVKGGKRIPKGYSLQDESNGLPYITVTDMNRGGVDSNQIRYVPTEIAESIKNYKITTNDIFISVAGTLGIVGIVPKELNNANLTENANKLTNLKCHQHYLLQYLLSDRLVNLIDNVQTVGAQPKLAIYALNSLEVSTPSLPEQTKIANFLTAVDEKITLLTQKADLLAQYKKGVMQQIFSQELRFKDDDGQEFPEWEGSELGKISTIIMGQSPDSKSYNDIDEGQPLIQGNADISNRKTNPRIWTSQPTKECKVNDIILTVRAPVGAVAKSYHNACIGRGVCAIRNNDKGTTDFIYQLLLWFEPTKWVSLEQGSTFTAVNSNDIKTLTIPVPCLKEQTKIANFLTAVDEKITTNQTQLNAVKQYKQGLLQQMFV